MKSVSEIFEQLVKKSSSISDGMMATSSEVINEVIIFMAYDISRDLRTIYIHIGESPWEEDQVNALPKWIGALVKMEYIKQLGPLKNQYFLAITQGDQEFGDLFETVIQNLMDNLSISQNEELFTIVYKVFERWKSFFKRGGYKKLTEEQQRGLFGELRLINDWIEINDRQPPLLIDSWLGPTKGRLDFVTQRTGVEIKTSLEKLTKSVRISNEQQLQETEAVRDIYLYVYFIEPSKTHGISLDEIIEIVKDKLSQFSQGLVVKFDELLQGLGYKQGDYSDIKYNIIREEAYKISQGFPRINKSDLALGISNVSYSIDLTHCEDYKISIEDIYNLI